MGPVQLRGWGWDTYILGKYLLESRIVWEWGEGGGDLGPIILSVHISFEMRLAFLRWTNSDKQKNNTWILPEFRSISPNIANIYGVQCPPPPHTPMATLTFDFVGSVSIHAGKHKVHLARCAYAWWKKSMKMAVDLSY